MISDMSGAAAAGDDIPPPLVLIVDDVAQNLDLMQALLRKEPVETVRATNGREAIERFQADAPDLVLLDLMMPGMDGLTVLDRLRALEGGRHVPIVIVTGAGDRSDRLRALEAGADDFLEKPFDRAILLARVRGLLRLKRHEDELLDCNQRLARIQSLQQDLAACIIHDLRSPITAISANLDYLLTNESVPAEESRAALSDAMSALRRLHAMVSDLLVIARLEQPDVELRRERVLLGDLAESVARAHARPAIERKVEMSVEVRGKTAVLGDPSLLGRVVDNLVENALRYTPRGGRILLAVDGATVSVCNSGAGMPAAERDRIFDKFHRLDASVNAGGNVGLGLSFCKYAVNAHRGTIRVEERAGWPVAFVVDLTACVEDGPRRPPSRRDLRAMRASS